MKIQNRKPHFHVTAGLVWDKGRVLIAKRPKGSHLEGLWEFPGGKKEGDERLAECMEREMAEELGIRVRAEEALLTVEHEYPTKTITLHVFNCTSLRGEARALQCQEVRWVDPKDLARFAFPPPDRKVIEALISPQGS
ncbi:MAG: 8-oxo-dGTP diphosphatase MutT [Desulfobacteraceae bacterium]|nr:8-oxo-dGTP diphosphatase MutT [Desulfobacteraceae bacterium]